MIKELTATRAATLLPARPPAGHKGTFGHALIIAGSRGFMPQYSRPHLTAQQITDLDTTLRR